MRDEAETVVVRIKYSVPAAALIALAAGATLAVLWATPMALPLAILAGTAIVCAALEAVHRVALARGAHGVRVLQVDGDGEVEIEAADGRLREGRLRPGSLVAPWLVIVRWRPANARLDRTVFLIPGMAPAEALRRLRVLLRWG